jgi:hypothetical protein
MIIDALSDESPLHTRELCRRIHHRKGDIIKLCKELVKKGILRQERRLNKKEFSLIMKEDNFFSFKFLDDVFKKLEQEADYEFDKLKNLKPITRMVISEPVKRQSSSNTSKKRFKSQIIKKARSHIDRISEILEDLDSCLLSLTYAEILFYASQIQKNHVKKRKQQCLAIIAKIIKKLQSLATGEKDPLSILWKISVYRNLAQIESIYKLKK